MPPPLAFTGPIATVPHFPLSAVHYPAFRMFRYPRGAGRAGAGGRRRGGPCGTLVPPRRQGEVVPLVQPPVSSVLSAQPFHPRTFTPKLPSGCSVTFGLIWHNLVFPQKILLSGIRDDFPVLAADSVPPLSGFFLRGFIASSPTQQRSTLNPILTTYSSHMESGLRRESGPDLPLPNSQQLTNSRS